ncbi:hypothetical protein PACTADRAFT_39701 [Pachysolen tannophilus NRRL Y-2460]|uniref:EF-hand domain-containing protein n=1 Tax=Pachysolen tannophilus NRRL Y-2460 TaxID=669874 RepID=A0A1E4TZB7_PACTA|nr:hypothetical protein PACTADRAFT_39701 [Pachysolen tannophilus NRRL Y-2460]
MALRNELNKPSSANSDSNKVTPSSNATLNNAGEKIVYAEAYSFFKHNFFGRVVANLCIAVGVVGTSVAGLILVFFLYDYSTYGSGKYWEDDTKLSVPELALSPERGGPENLPILRAQLDSFDSPSKANSRHKPKLVILGSGWGSVSLLKQLNSSDYDVTVISPTNYFLFTPMLPSAAVGTLEIKSICESIRSILSYIGGHYLRASAEKILFSEKLIKVSSTDPETGEIQKFYVPYDKLAIAVGSISNTHGVDGIQYCHKLKTAEDALTLRKKIVENLERACLPTTSDEERKKLLSFVVCGAGPTGTEVAAEISDLLSEDIIRGFPKILRQEVSVHIIQSRSHILNTYDKTISEYAMERFQKDSIDILTNSRVQKITADEVIFNQLNPETKEVELKALPYGLCLWSTGVGQNPLAQDVVHSLTGVQKNRRAIETDPHLRVIGAPLGDVYAIGDCSTVRTNIADHTTEYIRKFVVGRHFPKHKLEKNIITDDDIKHLLLTYDELIDLSLQIAQKHPLAKENLQLMHELLPKYDSNKTGRLTFDQVKALLEEVDSKVTSLPATAQRAHQQGKYLGKKLSKLARSYDSLTLNDILDGDIDDAVAKPFKYRHLGSLAYIGNSAALDISGHSFVGGVIAMYLWRSIYFAQSVSTRTRVLLFMDWLNRGIFGRDIITV